MTVQEPPEEPLDMEQFAELAELFGPELVEAIDDWHRDAIAGVQRIRTALDAGEAEGVRTAAHAVNGASSTFCALEVSHRAGQLEGRAREGQPIASQEVDDLAACVDRARAAMLARVASAPG